MKVGSWVYNALSRIARRLKAYMSPFLQTLATIGITFALAVKAFQPEKIDVISISALIGVVALILAYVSANREKAEEEKRHRELISILRAMAAKIGADVDKINKGK